MTLAIPERSLVLLVGASGAGKSTFAKKHFKPTEILSSDYCRGLVSDDENDQSASPDAFEILHFIAAKRLRAGRLTVIDATNVRSDSRRSLRDLARRYETFPVAIVLDLPEGECLARNQARPARAVDPQIIRTQLQELRDSRQTLEKEGFHRIYVLRTPAEIEAATITRQPG